MISSSFLSFWWKKPGYISSLLMPISMIYNVFASRNMTKKTPQKIDLPVLCIGNFTLGGEGKTPTTISFVKSAKKMGYIPGVVSRGFGGSYKNNNVHIVDVRYDNANEVGDEPLLLAEHTKVAVSSDRYLSAITLQKSGCDIIFMDDGFQSNHLYYDYSLIVFNGIRGFGNRQVFPSGPLRASLEVQIIYTDSILLIGEEKIYKNVLKYFQNSKKQIYQAFFIPIANNKVLKRNFVAFSGIGHPEKFFKSVEELGGILKKKFIFRDHYFFQEKDLMKISKFARLNQLFIATTSKDYIRIKNKKFKKYLNQVVIFDVNISFKTLNFCQNIINETIRRYKQRDN